VRSAVVFAHCGALVPSGASEIGSSTLERNVARQRGKQLAQRQRAFARQRAHAEIELAEHCRLGSPGARLPSEICA